MAGKRSIGTLLKNHFEDATRTELNSAHEIKFGTLPSQTFTDEELRKVVQEAWTNADGGRVATAMPIPAEREADDPAPLPKTKGIPNLSVSGKWQGRMRRVTIIKRQDCEHDYCQPVGWNGVIWNVPVGVPVDMPWPYYEAMKNTKLRDDGSDAVSRYERGPKGKVTKIITPTVKDTIPHIDHDDVPGTESLPTSYYDFFMREAKATQCFKNKTRSALIQIHGMLYEPKPMFAFRDMTNHDLRLEIAMRLGGEVEDIMRDEQYELEATG